MTLVSNAEVLITHVFATVRAYGSLAETSVVVAEHFDSFYLDVSDPRCPSSESNGTGTRQSTGHHVDARLLQAGTLAEVESEIGLSNLLDPAVEVTV